MKSEYIIFSPVRVSDLPVACFPMPVNNGRNIDDVTVMNPTAARRAIAIYDKIIKRENEPDM